LTFVKILEDLRKYFLATKPLIKMRTKHCMNEMIEDMIEVVQI